MKYEFPSDAVNGMIQWEKYGGLSIVMVDYRRVTDMTHGYVVGIVEKWISCESYIVFTP